MSRGIPVSFARYDWDALWQVIARSQRQDWDTAILVGPNMAALADRITELSFPTVFIPYDAFSLEAERRMQFTNSKVRRWYYGVQRQSWCNVERRLYPKFNRCVVVSAVERAAIAAGWPSYITPPVVIPPMISDVLLNYPSNESAEMRLIFSGNMSGPQSTDAVVFFYERVFLTLKKKFSPIRWYIVGRKPAKPIVNIGRSDPAVIVTGFVDDLRPFIAQAWIYVCPVRIGSGIKDRLLEGMALGRPSVVSPLSTMALAVEPGVHLFEASTAEEYVDFLTNLLVNRKLRAQVGENARQFVREH